MTPLPTEFLTRPLAHRGYHDLSNGIPENSRAAFEAAAGAGYGIELDVQLSADGEAMVFHDHDLDRVTGETGYVRQSRRSELEAMGLYGGTETIPALDDVLSLVAGRVPVLVEIKTLVEMERRDWYTLACAVASAVRQYHGQVAVMSFNPNVMDAFIAAAPGVPRGLTTCAFSSEDWPDIPVDVLARLRGVSDFDRLGATFISHCVSDLGNVRISELKAGGANVICWTVRSAREESKAREQADNITFEGYPARISAS